MPQAPRPMLPAMLTFTDTLPALSHYQLGSAAPVIGTAMLGTQFGTVLEAFLVRTGERVPITNDAGELLILLINNPGFVIEMTCAFELSVQPPGLLEEVLFPYLSIMGRVMEGTRVAFSGGERLLTLQLSQWDTMESAKAYRLLIGGGTDNIDEVLVAPAWQGMLGGVPLSGL